MLAGAADVRTRAGRWLFEVLVRCIPRPMRNVHRKTRGGSARVAQAVAVQVEGLSRRLSRPTEVTNAVTAMH